MTEITKIEELPPFARRFILHWGEMGGKWGLNRTVAQVHALLMISDRPLAADEITEVLGVARSNVSTSLRELIGWRVVRKIHLAGDRRDHFDSLKDPWELIQVVAAERKRREIDPVVAVMRECLQEAKSAPRNTRHMAKQIATLLDFIETMSTWYHALDQLDTPAIKRFVKLTTKVRRFLGRKKA